MCRFNLILTNDERAVRILVKNGYHKMFENLNEYEAYQKGYCNCGSCVGGMIEKKGRTFEESIAETKMERLERLYQIKEFMNQPGYDERKEIHNRTVDVFYQEMLQHKQEDPMELSPEHQTNLEMLRKYLLENDLMNESVCYYRTEEEENSKRNTGIPLNQIIEAQDELLLENINSEEDILEDIIELTLEPESLVIDAVIKRTEMNNYQNYKDEFEEYACLFRELLNEVPDIIFTTIWSEPENMNLVNTVSLDAFRIEDLVYLNFNEMIRVHGNKFLKVIFVLPLL
jgi:hypothetical protein